MDASNSKKGSGGFPKSVTEAPGSTNNRYQEQSEQQVELPCSIWAPILTLGGPILVISGFILELMGLIRASWELISGTPDFHFEDLRKHRGSILSMLQAFCAIRENI